MVIFHRCIQIKRTKPNCYGAKKTKDLYFIDNLNENIQFWN